MALTSIYYDGPVTESDRAQHLAGAPQYGVYGPEDFKVTAHPSIANAVLVKAGRAHGHGVTDIAAEDQVVNCTPLASGQVRWDLIVVRRNWQPNLGGPSTLVAIHAGATPTIPAQRKVSPGVEDDQPLFFVKWQGGISAPVQFVDMRVWAGNGGLYANDASVRSYMATVGTVIRIGDAVWTYKMGPNDTPGWDKSNPSRINVVGVVGQPSVEMGEAYVVTNAYSVARVAFDQPFPNACKSVVLTDSTRALNGVELKVITKAPTYFEIQAFASNGNGLINSGLFINYVAGGN